jgi:hypothetical protein
MHQILQLPGIGIDDMFILMSGMADGPSLLTASIEERMKYMLKKSGVAITITSISDLLAFTIGATSVFVAIRNFCIYTGIYFYNFARVSFPYVIQQSFIKSKTFVSLYLQVLQYFSVI